MASYNSTMRKLQTAINDKFNGHILIYSSQFYSEDQKRVCTCYHIKKAVYDEKKERWNNIELFSAYSTVQCTLFLRDYWFELNGWEIPHDNETWEKIKEERKWEKKAKKRK